MRERDVEFKLALFLLMLLQYWQLLFVELDDQILILQQLEDAGLNPARHVVDFTIVLLPTAQVERFFSLRTSL